MTLLNVTLAILGSLALAGLVTGLRALRRAKMLVDAYTKRADTVRQEGAANLEELQRRLESLGVEAKECRQQPGSPATVPQWSSLNPSKRSQALRMHRGGETADHIAAALELTPAGSRSADQSPPDRHEPDLRNATSIPLNGSPREAKVSRGGNHVPVVGPHFALSQLMRGHQMHGAGGSQE